jgi:hypothetical protein
MHKKGAKIVINSKIKVDSAKGFDICMSETTATNSRIKNLLIFNSSNYSDCEIVIPFSTDLPSPSNINITDPNVSIVKVTNKNCDLVISIKIDPEKTSFKKIFIKIGKNRIVNFTLNTCFIPLDSELFDLNKDYIIDPKNQNPSINFSYFKNSITIGNKEKLILNLSGESISNGEFEIPNDKGIKLTTSLIEDRQDIGNIDTDTILKIIMNDVSIPFKFTYSTNSIKQIKLNDMILKKIMTNSSVTRNQRNINLNGTTWNLTSKKELQKIKQNLITNSLNIGLLNIAGNSDFATFKHKLTIH